MNLKELLNDFYIDFFRNKGFLLFVFTFAFIYTILFSNIEGDKFIKILYNSAYCIFSGFSILMLNNIIFDKSQFFYFEFKKAFLNSFKQGLASFTLIILFFLCISPSFFILEHIKIEKDAIFYVIIAIFILIPSLVIFLNFLKYSETLSYKESLKIKQPFLSLIFNFKDYIGFLLYYVLTLFLMIYIYTVCKFLVGNHFIINNLITLIFIILFIICSFIFTYSLGKVYKKYLESQK